MADAYQNTTLWKRTLGKTDPHDPQEECRAELRSTFLAMRKNVAELVKLIPQDCRGITVHDITHLDALWETADIVCGDTFNLNPAEAFVFGGAVLLHDAGMSVATLADGMSELTKNTAWTDSVYAFYRMRGLKEPTIEMVESPPNQFKEQILFNVLRLLHAKRAEELVSQVWTLPTGEQIRLLENQDLRISLGECIGKIAHSHHWSIERVNSDLREVVGGPATMPAEWKINEKKIACLLRCADAAHIDHRRAPSILYALSKPKGTSERHWRFQHKLNKVTTKLDGLIYTSGQDFAVDEAHAWWLCHDAIKMIDRELSNANALLLDIGETCFAIKRVYGADSPRILAQYVRPVGWQPVDAEVRVSNASQLARTLGGRSLYGRGAFAPIRELLQNAVDSVRARRRLDKRPEGWGKVRLTLETQQSPDGEETWLHVDDTGLGMSERVLTGPLLDFGSSLWNSSLLQDEFPGLESRGIKPIGKFGIGFFSIFTLGEKVRVTSRPYNKGTDNIRALEFSSLDSRPILRNAESDELPLDFATRISVKIDKPQEMTEPAEFDIGVLRRAPTTIHQLMSEQVRRLIAAVDVDIEVSDQISGKAYTHAAAWQNTKPEEFLDEIVPARFKNRKEAIRAHVPLVSLLIDSSGQCVGRAALLMGSDDEHAFGSISVGGFVYSGRPPFQYIGVLEGDTDQVTRQRAQSLVADETIAKWASQQATLINPKNYSIYSLLRACHSILRLEGNPQKLPFCFLGGRFVSVHEFEATASSSEKIMLPLEKKYDEGFNAISLKGLATVYFADQSHLTKNIVAIQISAGVELLTKETGQKITGEENYKISRTDIEGRMSQELSLLVTKLSEIWKEYPGISVERVQVFSESLYDRPDKYWMLVFSRST